MRKVSSSVVSLFDPAEVVLRPDPVADAWYALDCPPDFDPRDHVTPGEYLRWRIDRAWRKRPVWLRQAFCQHRWIPGLLDSELAWCRNCQAQAVVKRDPAA